MFFIVLFWGPEKKEKSKQIEIPFSGCIFIRGDGFSHGFNFRRLSACRPCHMPGKTRECHWYITTAELGGAWRCEWLTQPWQELGGRWWVTARRGTIRLYKVGMAGSAVISGLNLSWVGNNPKLYNCKNPWATNSRLEILGYILCRGSQLLDRNRAHDWALVGCWLSSGAPEQVHFKHRFCIYEVLQFKVTWGDLQEGKGRWSVDFNKLLWFWFLPLPYLLAKYMARINEDR